MRRISIVLLLLLLHLLAGASCMSQKQDKMVAAIENEIAQELQVGDSFEEIESFLKDHGMVYDFDYDSGRFQARLPEDERKADNIAIYLYVDIDGRFLRAEVERVYTYL